MRCHTVFLDEWIRVRANRRLCAGTACSGCGKVKRWASVWCSIKTREVRCTKCFDAAAEHWRREDALMAEMRRRRRLEARP
jgi:hypothetical protein